MAVYPNKYRVASSYHRENFGMISIDRDQTNPVITLGILDIDGQAKISRFFPLSTKVCTDLMYHSDTFHLKGC